MRAYTVATTAVTLRMPVKWLDNVLSQHHVAGVIKLRQGVARKLTPRAVVTLDVALRLSKALDTSIPVALQLASRLLEQSQAETGIDAGEGLHISINIRQIEAEVMERLAHAVEIAPSPRRGRPRRRV